MTIKQFKILKRLLKELGIFHAWCKNRKNYVSKLNPLRKNTFGYNLLAYHAFSSIITCSFSWAETPEGNDFWAEIYNYKPGWDLYPHDILKDEKKINELKETIKNIYPNI